MTKLITFDIECYPNYFLIAMRSLRTNNTLRIEMRGEDSCFDTDMKRKVFKKMNRYTSFGFNSNNYDIPMMLLALKGFTCAELKAASDKIITTRSPGWMTMRKYDLEMPPKWNSFDLMEPSPGVGVGLKLYGARMHSKRLQELPYPHDTILSDAQCDNVSLYCDNDLDTNLDLYDQVKERIALRVAMGKEYDLDLRSKSDAQMAEAIFKHELLAEGVVAKKQSSKEEDFTMTYQAPGYINFHSEDLIDLLFEIEETDFTLDKKASIALPEWLKKHPITIGDTTYKIGVGGLHSQEKKVTFRESKDTILADRDVASYYPRIILSQGLYPPHLGESFLQVYDSLVERRLEAKKTGDKITDAGLKISINGSFGKLGSKYSFLYAPEQLLAVTLTGQLALIMLIERLEEHGIPVVSANTDGFVSMIPKKLYELYDGLCSAWEDATGFTLEETRYKALHSRDVNNYMAVKQDKTTKGKGVFATPGLMKNPVSSICVKAAEQYLLYGTPLRHTIRASMDISEFITVRSVTGGGVWNDTYLGKVVRWYYATDGASIHYQKNGNKVATSDGAYPVMDLPEKFPLNIDYDKYIDMTKTIIENVGVPVDS